MIQNTEDRIIEDTTLDLIIGDNLDDDIADKNPAQHIVFGIDLGTTNSCISIWRNNNIEIIPDEHGNRTIPSYVSFTEFSKYIGLDAKNQRDINIENVFFEFKRLIGRLFSDKSVQDCIRMMSYKIIENERGCIGLQSSVRNNKIFTPEELSAMVLLKLKNMAIQYLERTGGNSNNSRQFDAVITVPAHFSDAQRQATKDAATIAGINCLRIIHEPTAAALAYGMLDRTVKKALNSDDNGMTILVYDLGGGTLDCSLIYVYDGVFEVRGSAGISHFGGIDFDNRMIAYSMTKFSRQYYQGKLELDQISRMSLQKLRMQCESAKKVLSTNTTAYIIVEEFHDSKDLIVKITRDDFENLCRDLFLLCLKSVDDLMNECSITVDEIDEVILVGGMTRVPHIREMLGLLFRPIGNKNRINCSVNPDEAVSVGAAIQGYIIANHDDPFSDQITLLDCTPLSLGVEVMGGVMDRLIKRNTQIPYEVTQLYSTDTDYVDEVLIKVYEGERSVTHHNILVGEFILQNIPKRPKGVPKIEITFSIDCNGMVTVTAMETENKEMKTITVNTNRNGLKEHMIRQLVAEAMDQEAMDELDRAKRKDYFQITDMINNITSNLDNLEYRLSDTDKQLIRGEIEDINLWMKKESIYERNIECYDTMITRIKGKYGTLILRGHVEDLKTKGVSAEIQATLIRDDENDPEEDEMRQAFEKVRNSDYVEGMSDQDLSELKEMRNNLDNLCGNLMDIIRCNQMKLSSDHRKELTQYIDDMMLWSFSHEKPTKQDYIEKIDNLNRICDQIVERYESDNIVLFEKTDRTIYEILEERCLSLIVMIQNNQLPGSSGRIGLLQIQLEDCIKYIYDPANEGQPPDNMLMQKMLDDLNELVTRIEQSSMGINIDTKILIQLDDKKGEEKKGMSIMDLLKIKQNEEINQMIEKQLDENQ